MTQDDWCVLFLKVLEDDNTSEEVFEDRMVQLTAILLLLAFVCFGLCSYCLVELLLEVYAPMSNPSNPKYAAE